MRTKAGFPAPIVVLLRTLWFAQSRNVAKLYSVKHVADLTETEVACSVCPPLPRAFLLKGSVPRVCPRMGTDPHLPVLATKLEPMGPKRVSPHSGTDPG